jgi:hypothetical protein
VSAHAAPRGLTRTQVLAAAAAGGAAIVAAPLVAALAGAERAADAPAAIAAPSHLHRGAWVGLPGATLAARTADGTREELLLEAVTDIRSPSPAGADDAFALRFAPPPGSPPVDGLRTIEHPRLGPVELWLGAVGPAGPAQRLQAVVLAGPPPAPGRS